MKKLLREKQLNTTLSLCRTNRRFRQKLTYKSHLWFFYIFLSHYITYPFSWFHKEMFMTSQKRNLKLAVVMAFRGSGKSTILNTSFCLWSVLGKPQKKFVIIISQSRIQAKTHFENVKNELTNNDLLRNDLGPFQSSTDDWGGNFIEIEKFQAKIMFIGSGQSLRGLRHGVHRPDLIICDDIEDSMASSSSQKRKKLNDWFRGEVMPAGDKNTTTIVLGNLLDESCLLMQLKKSIDDGSLAGIFRAYPLLDDEKRILWPEKFSSNDEISKLKETISDQEVWEREYLLSILPKFIIYYPAKMDKNYKKPEMQPLNSYGYRISAPIIGSGIVLKYFDESEDGEIKEISPEESKGKNDPKKIDEQPNEPCTMDDTELMAKLERATRYL